MAEARDSLPQPSTETYMVHLEGSKSIDDKVTLKSTKQPGREISQKKDRVYLELDCNQITENEETTRFFAENVLKQWISGLPAVKVEYESVKNLRLALHFGIFYIIDAKFDQIRPNSTMNLKELNAHLSQKQEDSNNEEIQQSKKLTTFFEFNRQSNTIAISNLFGTSSNPIRHVLFKVKKQKLNPKEQKLNLMFDKQLENCYDVEPPANIIVLDYIKNCPNKYQQHPNRDFSIRLEQREEKKPRHDKLISMTYKRGFENKDFLEREVDIEFLNRGSKNQQRTTTTTFRERHCVRLSTRKLGEDFPQLRNADVVIDHMMKRSEKYNKPQEVYALKIVINDLPDLDDDNNWTQMMESLTRLGNRLVKELTQS